MTATTTHEFMVGDKCVYTHPENGIFSGHEVPWLTGDILKVCKYDTRHPNKLLCKNKTRGQHKRLVPIDRLELIPTRKIQNLQSTQYLIEQISDLRAVIDSMNVTIQQLQSTSYHGDTGPR